MSESAPYPWPLQPGHAFGPTDYDLRYHNGKESLTDFQALARWQRAYYQRVNRYHVKPTGRFDGVTQDAVVTVQKLAGLPVTGVIDQATWDAVWWVDRPPPKPVKPPKPRPFHNNRIARYWQAYSASDLNYGKDPDAPPWYPGKPFGPHERGLHIFTVQQKLGIEPVNGIFSNTMASRIRGLQMRNGLVRSGIIDVATARVIDPPPWDE